MPAKFVLYKDARGEFRWKLVASNGETIVDSAEGYKQKDSAKKGITSVKRSAATAKVEEK